MVREDPKNDKFYNLVTINKTLFNSLEDGRYLYSFALFPTFFQPSGQCNFSQIAESYLKFRLSNDIIDQYNNLSSLYGELNVWCCSMNIFRVISGMGGLAWTNMNDH